MSAGGTLEALLAFIRDEGNVPPDDADFGPDVDLFDFGYLDSFGLVRLTEWTRERFGFDMGNADFYAGVRTAAQIADYIDRERPA
jgi:hypothetical protein